MLYCGLRLFYVRNFGKKPLTAAWSKHRANFSGEDEKKLKFYEKIQQEARKLHQRRENSIFCLNKFICLENKSATRKKLYFEREIIRLP